MQAVQVLRVRDPATLVRDHQAEVWRYLRFLGCSREQAEDLTQEAFLRLLSGRFVDQGRAAAAAWLRSTARNLWREELRRPVAAQQLDEADAAFAGFARDDGGDGYLEALRACLQQLGHRARQAVAMRYEGRMSRRAIARALGLGGDGVKSLLRRANAVLRGCVERRLRGET